jgi:Spy/CpxP family protein refolding chaperone
MEYKKISFTLFSLILSAFLLTTTAYADWKKADILKDIGCEFPNPQYLLHNRDVLKLNANQVDQLKKLKFSSKKAKAQKYADLKIHRIELNEILDGKSVDKRAVESKIELIGNLYTQIAKDKVVTRLAARELLTDKQFQKWGTIIEDRIVSSWPPQRKKK